MNKLITRTRTHHLGKLHTELEVAISNLRPVVNQNGVKEAKFSISGDGSIVKLWVPNDVTEVEVDAVLRAHNPTSPAAVPTPRALYASARTDEERQAIIARQLGLK
jgi:hypothetical protein